MGLPVIAINELLAWIGGFIWPLIRIGALLLAAPIFGARTIPMRLRAALALLLTLIVFPQVSVPGDLSALSLSGVMMMIREALIGTGMGFLLQMLFGAIAMAGEIIALSMGLAFASIIDPERGVSVPLVSQHFVLFSTLIFLALDGHLALLMLLIDSFHFLPPAVSGLGGAGFFEIALWGSRMFEAAVLVALPAAASLLVAAVSMGLIARSAPQLNIFAVGFPMTLLLGIVALYVSLPLLLSQVEYVLEALFERTITVWGAWR